MANGGPLDVLAARLCDEPFELEPGSRCVVAFSGGLDSTFLLHALVRLGFGAGLTAVHVDHGLHADSAAWSIWCGQVATELGVRFRARRVAVAAGDGESIEGAARHARYAALAEELGPGDWLMTAHHADDQLETVLYRLLRGTGVRGLRGIHECERFASGRIGRPLLDLTRAQILALAQEWQLEWIDDPSNVDMRFDRNFLRAEVLPLLTRRWPGAAASAVRCARAAGDAEAILDSVARADARYFDALDRLPIVMLRRMDAPRRRNFLRYVVAALGLPQPSARQLAALEHLCDSARARASAQWTGAQAHRFKGFIYLLSALSSAPEQAAVGVLTDVQPLELPCGTVTATPTEGPGLPAAWLRSGLTVRYRSGGERFQPPGAPREIPLKEWLRSIGVVPWMRSRIPIFVHDGQIVAVGDLGVSANAQIAGDGAARMRIVWEHRPRVY